MAVPPAQCGAATTTRKSPSASGLKLTCTLVGLTTEADTSRPPAVIADSDPNVWPLGSCSELSTQVSASVPVVPLTAAVGFRPDHRLIDAVCGHVRVGAADVDDQLVLGGRDPGLHRLAAAGLLEDAVGQVEPAAEVGRVGDDGKAGDVDLARRLPVGHGVGPVELGGEAVRGPGRHAQRAVAERDGRGRVGVGLAEHDVVAADHAVRIEGEGPVMPRRGGAWRWLRSRVAAVAASAGSGPLARTRPVAAARAAAATAASRRALASGRPAGLGGGDDGTDGGGGLNDTVASMASASVDSPTADCPAVIR